LHKAAVPVVYCAHELNNKLPVSKESAKMKVEHNSQVAVADVLQRRFAEFATVFSFCATFQAWPLIGRLIHHMIATRRSYMGLKDQGLGLEV